MGQKDGEKWTAEVDSQPTFPKPDRLLGACRGNVSRGSTVHEPALLDALENHHIAGAGLDEFWHEPRIDARFMALHNVVLQPHHASGTFETRQAMAQLARDNLCAHFAGQPLLAPVV